jgi:hypothetical protein
VETQRFKADLLAWLVAVCLPGLFFVLFAIMAAAERGWGPRLGLIGLGLSVVLFGAAWVASFEIVLAPDSLFSGRRTIRRSDIMGVRFAWEIGNGLQGPLRVVIEPRSAGQRSLSINAKVFSREAISAVVDLADAALRG